MTGNKPTVGLFERGAYEYELRLSRRAGFSDEYMAKTRIDDYFTPSVAKKVAYDPKLRSLWR